MARFYGIVGFEETVETAPGVWTERITERPYFGDVIRNARRLQSAEQLNDNVNISNEISILADAYAMNHFHTMRYVVYMGTKWKVSNISVQHPRLTLSLGDIYHESD